MSWVYEHHVLSKLGYGRFSYHMNDMHHETGPPLDIQQPSDPTEINFQETREQPPISPILHPCSYFTTKNRQ